MAALPDRAPPELEPGVTIDSLVTVEDCDAALDRLTMSIASIEDQLARVSRHSPNQPADWRQRTEMALRIKKLLLPRLQQRRANVARKLKEERHLAAVADNREARNTKHRALLTIVREIAPEVMSRADRIAQERFPDLFEGGEASR